MSLSTPSRRRWTESTIESELRTQLAELGHFPTRAELMARGLRGLWDAMRTAGGVEAWQARLEDGPLPVTAAVEERKPSPDAAAVEQQTLDATSILTPPPTTLPANGHEATQAPPAPSSRADIEPAAQPGRAASQEEIAARAYELYERGVEGDSVTHWLEAEQQLAASPVGE